MTSSLLRKRKGTFVTTDPTQSLCPSSFLLYGQTWGVGKAGWDGPLELDPLSGSQDWWFSGTWPGPSLKRDGKWTVPVDASDHGQGAWIGSERGQR